HSTSSKRTASAISTAKSLFLLRKSTQKKSGFSVPPTGGSKINRVGGMLEVFGATKLRVSSWLAMCSELQSCTKPTFSYPIRTRSLYEGRAHRLDEMGPSSMVFAGGARFCNRARDGGF